MAKRWWVRAVFVMVAAVALANGGCLALAIGGAAGGAAAGYALYQRGQWYRDYPATLTDSASAAKTALTELQLPLVNEKIDAEEVNLESRTCDGDKIQITLKPVASRVPADGATTHISIRVGFGGDEALSTRILEQTNLHLVAPVVVRPSASNPAPAPAPSGTLPQPPRETAEPPPAK
jgi:hypothetical protein